MTTAASPSPATDTPGRILDAAEELLVEHGSMRAVSMRAIAEAVGLTPAALYGHFRDKDGLFLAVCTRRFAEFAATLEQAAAGASGPLERIQRMGRAYVAYGLEHPGHYHILFVSDLEPAPELLGDEQLPGVDALQLLADTIREGIEQGALREVDPEAAAVSLWATVHGVVLLAGRGDAGSLEMPGVERLTDVAIDLVLHGLQAR